MIEVEKAARKFLEDRGWDKLRPSDLAKSICIEAAELLELFQWNNQELEKVRADKEKMSDISKELADVFIYCLQMSVLLGMDTKKIILDKLDFASAKYPPELFKKAKKNQEQGTQKIYQKIKKSYRINRSK